MAIITKFPCQFNSTPLHLSGTIEQPSQELIKNTLGLWNVSVEDAMKYGGDLTRMALSAMNFRNDRKYIVVDTKIHMLKPGMFPAIPGWHTDGVPRDSKMRPDGLGLPRILDQLPLHVLDDFGDLPPIREPRFHLLVTGEGCLTEFIDRPFVVDIDPNPSDDLYYHLTQDVKQLLSDGSVGIYTIPSCQVVEWSWWDVHRGIRATKSEWRFLIRVVETDYLQPQTDPRKFIRTQQQVYVESESFGW